MNLDPNNSSPIKHRDILATYTTTNTNQHKPYPLNTSRSSSPANPHSPPINDNDDSNDYSSRLTTPRPEQDETQSAAALALLGLSMRTSSETPSSKTDHPPPSPSSLLGAIAMRVTLSSASDSASSSTDSTGSTRMSNVSNISVRKRRSSDSSGQTDDMGGKEKRLKWSEESGSPSGPKAKTDGWSDDMKRVYEQAAYALPPSGREQRRMFGDMRGRNEQLGLWVTLAIGTYCGRKRISSHSQTLKNHHSTNPELKKFLTTDSSCNPTSPSDPSAWPLRLKQLVHRAYQSLPNAPPLPPAEELDIASIALPAIPVRILRKDGVEVEMSLPDAIEYDKADQRSKNRDKKPTRGPVRPAPSKKSRTATPTHSRGDSYPAYGNSGRGGRSPSSSQAYSPGGQPAYSTHGRASSNTVTRDVDRGTRYRQYSHTNADLPPHYHNHTPGHHNHQSNLNHHGHNHQGLSIDAGPSVMRPQVHPASAPVFWDRKIHATRPVDRDDRDDRDSRDSRDYHDSRDRRDHRDHHRDDRAYRDEDHYPPLDRDHHEDDHPPLQSPTYPVPRSSLIQRQHPPEVRYDQSDEEDDVDDEDRGRETPPPRQPHPPSLDFLLDRPMDSPVIPESASKRSFWKSG